MHVLLNLTFCDSASVSNNSIHDFLIYVIVITFVIVRPYQTLLHDLMAVRAKSLIERAVSLECLYV